MVQNTLARVLGMIYMHNLSKRPTPYRAFKLIAASVLMADCS